MIQIDSSVREKLPQLRLGVIHYHECTITRSPQQFRGRFNLFLEQVRLEYEQMQIGEIPLIASWRKAFRQIGTAPSRYRPSAEALLRRVLKGEMIHEVNSGVDVNNLFSLQSLLPFGIYDRKLIDPPIICTIGGEEDRYEGLNGRPVSMENKLLLRDANGPFGSPYVDAKHTAITEKSNDCLQVIFSLEDEHSPDLNSLLQKTSTLFTQINGGKTVDMAVVK